MLMVCVAVKDRAIEGFSRPFFVRHRGEAVRSFIDEINRPDSELFKHPEDFDLYVLGIWDDGTGAFSDMKSELLIRGADARKGSA